jgi:hypothetical protein
MKQNWTEKKDWERESTLDLVLINDNRAQQWERYNKQYDCRCTGAIYKECRFFSGEFCMPFVAREQDGLSENVWYYDCEK